MPTGLRKTPDPVNAGTCVPTWREKILTVAPDRHESLAGIAESVLITVRVGGGSVGVHLRIVVGHEVVRVIAGKLQTLVNDLIPLPAAASVDP